MTSFVEPATLDAIRCAFRSGEFTLALRLWKTYAARVESAIREGKATAPMLEEARALIGDARLVVLAFRAHAADRIGGVRAAAAYEETARGAGGARF